MRSVALLAGAAGALAQSDCSPGMFWVNYFTNPDQMAVAWATSCESDSTVQYGLTPSALTLTASGNSSTYSFAASGYVSPYLHQAVLSGLPLATTIYYRVGGSSSGYSPVMNFTSHPGVGPDMPFTYGIIGDLGQTTNSVTTVQHVASNAGIQAIVLAGDLSYADKDQPRWDEWANMVSYVSSHTPWMTAVGNHELEVDSDFQSFEAYRARFNMPPIYPGTPQQTSGSLFYSFKAGPVHWIVLSSYTEYAPSTEGQYGWLVNELAQVDRTVTPWLVVVLHAPWYSSNQAHQGEGEPMRQVVEDLLYLNSVDLVFTGHVHAYERCYRTYQWQRNPAAPYYIGIGDGGNREGLASSWSDPQPEWSAFRQASYGHGVLQFYNSTHAYWGWHQNPDLEPTVADSLWIVKGQDGGGKQVTTKPIIKAQKKEAVLLRGKAE